MTLVNAKGKIKVTIVSNKLPREKLSVALIVHNNTQEKEA